MNWHGRLPGGGHIGKRHPTPAGTGARAGAGARALTPRWRLASWLMLCRSTKMWICIRTETTARPRLSLVSGLHRRQRAHEFPSAPAPRPALQLLNLRRCSNRGAPSFHLRHRASQSLTHAIPTAAWRSGTELRVYRRKAFPPASGKAFRYLALDYLCPLAVRLTRNHSLLPAAVARIVMSATTGR